MFTANKMAIVRYDPGISSVSGALAKPKKDGQHTCEKMLLATHRTAATTSSDCNRIYLRQPVKRTSPLTQREHQIRNRFIGVAAMIAERSHDLSKITTDQQTFIAQKNEPNGCKTMKKWYWKIAALNGISSTRKFSTGSPTDVLHPVGRAELPRVFTT